MTPCLAFLASFGLGSLAFAVWMLGFELPKVRREAREMRAETERLQREHREFMRRH